MNIKDLVTHWDEIKPETKIHINFNVSVGNFNHGESYCMCCLDILVSEDVIFNMDLTDDNIDYYFGINSTGVAYIVIKVWG